jgi:hypothetical protein
MRTHIFMHIHTFIYMYIYIDINMHLDAEVIAKGGAEFIVRCHVDVRLREHLPGAMSTPSTWSLSSIGLRVMKKKKCDRQAPAQAHA